MVKRVCLTCHRLIGANRSRCVECQRAEWRRRNRMRPVFERTLYGSGAWKKLATAVVVEASCCAWCGATGVPLSGDHVTPVRAAPELALDRGNVVAACRSCQERRKRPHRPPGAGGDV